MSIIREKVFHLSVIFLYIFMERTWLKYPTNADALTISKSTVCINDKKKFVLNMFQLVS